MVLESDVLIENYKAGSLKKIRTWPYESLSQINQNSCIAQLQVLDKKAHVQLNPATVPIIQAWVAWWVSQANAMICPVVGHQKAGLAFADLTTGLYAAIAIQAALLSRVTTGEGQHIDMALLDTSRFTFSFGDELSDFCKSARPLW